MANVVSTNQPRNISVNFDDFCVVWALVAALIKAGAVYKAGSNGTTKDTTGSILNYPWSSLQAVQNGTGPTLAQVTNGGLVTVTGLSGLTLPTDSNKGGSEGNFLTFTGFATSANNGTFQIVEVVSATACRFYNASAVQADANNGQVGVTWAERSILGATYTASNYSAKAPWIVLEMNRMIKVPITAAVSGLLRGEKVTQGSGTTLCEGEFLGSVFDSVGVTGWAVIQPRDRNTWGTGVITGGSSGATFTPSATPRVFANEQVFWKDSSAFDIGSIYWSCLDVSSDNANLFSVLATNAACTAAIAPGGTATGTGASMPTVPGVMVVMGSAAVAVGATWGAASQSGTTSWFGVDPPTSTVTNYHLLCANGMGTPTSPSVSGAAATLGRSPDSSYTVVGYTTTPTPYGMHWGRVDDAEPGDVCPYVVHTLTNASGASFNRFIATATSSPWATGSLFPPSGAFYRGFASRGSGQASRDIAEPFYFEGGSNNNLFATNFAVVPREMNHPAVTPPYKTAGYFLTQDGTTNTSGSAPIGLVKGRKGRLRWWRMQPTGTSLDTYDNKRWLGILQGTTSNPGHMVGPWDQSSVPASSLGHGGKGIHVDHRGHVFPRTSWECQRRWHHSAELCHRGFHDVSGVRPGGGDVRILPHHPRGHPCHRRK